MKLKTKFILVYGLGGLLVLLILTVLVFNRMQQAMVYQLNQQFQTDIATRINNFNNQLTATTNRFRSAAVLPMFKAMRYHQLTLNKASLKDDIRQLELYFLDMIRQQKGLEKIRFVDEKGKEIFHVASNGIKKNLFDLSSDPSVRKILENKDEKVNITIDSLYGEKTYLTWWIPVYITEEMRQGVLSFSIAFNDIEEAMSNLVDTKTESICVKNRLGEILFKAGQHMSCEVKKDGFWEKTIISDQTNLDWQFSISVNPEIFLTEVNEIKNLVFRIIFPTVAAIALILSISFSNRISSTVTRLADAAKIMGRGDNFPKINIKRDDELGELAIEMSRSARMIEQHRESLQEKNRDLEAYSYTLAHDLRTPLRTITSFSQILETEIDDNLTEEHKNFLQRIINASRRMSYLIDDILELYRISNREIKVHKVSLSKSAESVIDHLKEQGEQRNVIVEIEPDLDVDGDSQLLRLVLENLLENAWKYTGRKDQAIIRFGSKQENEKIVYYIQDNGAGFEMQFVDKLFKPFQRLHNQEEFEGTGIGLASVKRIIDRHKGKIWIKSVVDEGTTVYFTLWEKEHTKEKALAD